jgi:hypothetical protein
VKRGLGAGTAELIALRRLLRDRGEHGPWDQAGVDEPVAVVLGEPVGVAAIGDLDADRDLGRAPA